MTRRSDVVVIGAGPAGSLAAQRAACLGLDVLLVDRASFPRDKVCGCCLNARAVQILSTAGLADLPGSLGAHRLRGAEVHVARRRTRFDLQGSVAVSRGRLDNALVQAARQEGARFLDATAATLGDPCPRGRIVHLQDATGRRREVRAGLVFVADGLSGTALRRYPELAGRVAPDSYIGAGALIDRAPPDWGGDHITLVCGEGGYVGIVGVEQSALDVAAALDRSTVHARGGPGAVVTRMIEQAGLPGIPELASARWRGTPALTRQRTVVAGERFLVLGDAAGYVEPFTGEGIAWALESADAVAGRVVSAATAWEERHATEWTRRHQTSIRRRQWACRAVSGTLRRAWLTRPTLALLGRFPGLAAPLIQRLTQPDGRSEAVV